jgi:hypothetical protein
LWISGGEFRGQEAAVADDFAGALENALHQKRIEPVFKERRTGFTHRTIVKGLPVNAREIEDVWPAPETSVQVERNRGKERQPGKVDIVCGFQKQMRQSSWCATEYRGPWIISIWATVVVDDVESPIAKLSRHVKTTIGTGEKDAN